MDVVDLGVELGYGYIVELGTSVHVDALSLPSVPYRESAMLFVVKERLPRLEPFGHKLGVHRRLEHSAFRFELNVSEIRPPDGPRRRDAQNSPFHRYR